MVFWFHEVTHHADNFLVVGVEDHIVLPEHVWNEEVMIDDMSIQRITVDVLVHMLGTTVEFVFLN